ncbi:MAG: hypothetical protein V3574_05405, partial [Candidatus Moraniibacteriota bacterium]
GVGYLMWTNGSTAAFWKISTEGNRSNWKSYRAAGWKPVSLSFNKENTAYLMWSNLSTAGFWKIDEEGNAIGWKSFSATGWTPKLSAFE